MHVPTRISAGALAGLLAVAILALDGPPVGADDALETRQLVEKARFTVDAFVADPNMEPFRDLVRKARGIFVAPQLLKAAFIVGASGGSGVLLARDEQTGEWRGPAFYTVGGASFGLQIGAQASEVVLLAMTERGVTALLSNTVKLGGDVGIAVGPTGLGMSGETANLSADLVSFSISKGLYGGVSLQGAVVAVRKAWNSAYYGREVTPTDIFIRRAVTNPQATELVEAVKRAAGGK